jgi:hypothetical protein
MLWYKRIGKLSACLYKQQISNDTFIATKRKLFAAAIKGYILTIRID